MTTLALPTGRLIATVATVNDVHFGEKECGKLGIDEEIGPVFTHRARRDAVLGSDERGRDRRDRRASIPTR